MKFIKEWLFTIRVARYESRFYKIQRDIVGYEALAESGRRANYVYPIVEKRLAQSRWELQQLGPHPMGKIVT